MLLFKKKFLDAIRSGSKSQMIRLWPRRQMRAGQRSYILGVGYICSTEVAAVQLTELADDNAVPDGFETTDALRTEIMQLYSDKLAVGYQSYRVVFHVLPEEEQHK